MGPSHNAIYKTWWICGKLFHLPVTLPVFQTNFLISSLLRLLLLSYNSLFYCPYNIQKNVTASSIFRIYKLKTDN